MPIKFRLMNVTVSSAHYTMFRDNQKTAFSIQKGHKQPPWNIERQYKSRGSKRLSELEWFKKGQIGHFLVLSNSTFPNSLSVWAVKLAFPPFSRCFPPFSRVKWACQGGSWSFRERFLQIRERSSRICRFSRNYQEPPRQPHFTQENDGK